MDTESTISHPRAELLPTNTMAWERLETLIRRIAQDVEGLRDVQTYGTRGQSQYGIDVVGTDVDGSRHGFQGKKYLTFKAADLTKAVQKFVDEHQKIPFAIVRLVVVAGCLAERTEVTDELYRLQDLYRNDVRIELWHQRQISDNLRNRPDIVMEFFGESVTEAFCLPVEQHVVAPPPTDRVHLADALVHGPIEITGANVHLAEATRLEPTDPAGAILEVERASELLKKGGFEAHASVVLDRRANLFSRAGEHDKAARQLADSFWSYLDVDRQTPASNFSKTLMRSADSENARTLGRITELALEVVHQPLGWMPGFNTSDLRSEYTELDLARLVLLMAENAAIDPADTWRRENLDSLQEMSDAVQQHGSTAASLACRLQIEVAEITGEWKELLDNARRQKVRRAQAVLIFARYGLYAAERGEPELADSCWQDAMTQACLNGQDAAAAEYVFSRQILRYRYRGPIQGSEQALIRNLRARSGKQSQAERLEDEAMRALLEGKTSVAVPLLRAFHRRGYSAGAWGQVLRARQMLADAYAASDEPELAIGLYAAACQIKKAEAVSSRHPNTYLDIRNSLKSRAYWIAGTGYRIVAAQADLVPDEQVPEIAAEALAILDNALAGTLLDGPYDSSIKSNAFKALSALADRIPTEHARRLLEHTRPWVPRKKNHYHHTDDDHVRACAAIARTDVESRIEALDQLMGLVDANDSGVSQRAERAAHELVQLYPELVRERLKSMAEDKNEHAVRLLLLITTDLPTDAAETVLTAADRLSRPPANTSDFIGIGTGAPDQALLARALPAERRKQLAHQQLKHAESPYEMGSNRTEYYEAARILAYDLDDIGDLFEIALLHTQNGNPSQGDVLHNLGNHPLSLFRTTGFPVDTRAEALWLTATIARSDHEKQQVREIAYTLIGTSEQGDLYIAKALRSLDLPDIARDLPLLASQSHWALRSIAALAWAATPEASVGLGRALASDTDPKVRRALASALADATNVATDEIRSILTTDSCYSVRRLARRRQGDPA